MVLSAFDLPDDVDALKAMIVAMNAEGVAARAEIARLEALKKIPTSGSPPSQRL